MLNRLIGACCLLIVPVTNLHADDFIVRAGVDVQSVDNARNATVEALEIKEKQTVASLVMAGEIASRYVRFISDASYINRRFSEQTAQNNDLFLGSAALELGDGISLFYGSASHRAEELLIDSLLGDAPENLDRRSVTSGTLGLRVGRRANRFSLYGNATESRFDSNGLNDSSRVGGGLSFHRLVGPLSTFGLELSGYSLDYLNVDSVSFDYRRASISWETELRQLSYAVNVGRNSIGDGSDSSESSPFYEVGLGYEGAVHQVSLTFKQWLTDTSQGSEGGGSVAGPDGQLSVTDQYKMRKGELSWQSSFVCGRCDASLILGTESENYRREKQLDSEEYAVSMGFDYRARRTLIFDVGYELRQVDLLVGDDDYDQANARIGIAWSEVFKHGRFRLFVERSERKFRLGLDDYTQDIAGVSFDYQLYRR